MTYRHAFVKWLGSASLALTMTGCPTGDDGDTTGVTSLPPPPPTTGAETDTPTSTGEEPSTGAGTTMSMEETTAAMDTSGGVTCDPPCEAGQECIGGTCFDMPPPGDSSSGDPPPPTNSDYGPCDACAAGEIPVMVGMIEGCFCSPACDGQGSMCAAPNEGTATPMCVLELMMGEGPTQCALICMDTADCPPGATCEDAGGAGVCVHPAG